MSFTTSSPEVDSCQEVDSSFLLVDDMLFPFIAIDFSFKVYCIYLFGLLRLLSQCKGLNF